MAWTKEEVRTGIHQLAAHEKQHVALYLRYLIDVERYEIHLEDGGSSMVDYCERILGLCHGTALKRVWVARAAAKFPAILTFLEEGRLTLTAISWMVRHLTEENHLKLLEEAVGKKETELKWWLSKVFPKEIPPDWELNGREKVIPFDGKRAKFLIVVDEEFMELLAREKEVHKHEFPDENSLEILKKAMTVDLAHHDPIEKAKRARKPKKTNSSKNIVTRAIPAGIAYAEHKEAGSQCRYVSPSGVRCAERAGLEKDHVRSWANGGKANRLEDVQLLCFAHNQYKARLEFKKDFRKPRPWR